MRRMRRPRAMWGCALLIGTVILTIVVVMRFEARSIQATWQGFCTYLERGERDQALLMLDSQSLSSGYIDTWETLLTAERAEVGKLEAGWSLPWVRDERQAMLSLTLPDGQRRSYSVVMRRGALGWRIFSLPELYASPAALLYPEDDAMFLQVGVWEMDAFALPWTDTPQLGLAICQRDELLYWEPADTVQEARILAFDEGWLYGETGSHVSAGRLDLYQRRLGQPCRVLPSFSPGMTDVTLCFWQGKVVGALLDPDWQPERIRVLLGNEQDDSRYHSAVFVEDATGVGVRRANGTCMFPESPLLQLSLEGEEVVLYDAEGLPVQRSGGGSLQLMAEDMPIQLRFGQATRSYRGVLEVSANAEGLVLINDLPLEQYLRGVVGNEMPELFGTEALRLQAIIARSYALRAILQPSGWQVFGAHLDDSMSSQVYLRNGPERAAGDAAVAITTGEVLFYDDQPALAFFFSTAGGFTAAPEEAWPSGPGLSGNAKPYLRAQAQGYGLPEQRDEAGILSFYLRSDWAVPDRGSPWFRWQVQLSQAELSALLAENVRVLSASAGELIQLCYDTGVFRPPTEVLTEEWLGEVTELMAVQRGTNGQLVCLEIRGSRATCRVHGELLIRRLFQPRNGLQPVYLLPDGERQLDLLPSAFVVWRTSADAQSLVFYGGGFGHGVGLSQYGARGLLEEGWSVPRILDHYYPGTTLLDWRDWWGS